MEKRRILYTIIVIILTFITVGTIISMKINETNSYIYDKHDINLKVGYNSYKNTQIGGGMKT